ncbi:MAG: DoxX family protein [Haloferacaceae archaeon]
MNGELLLAGRLLFGGVLAFLGANHFADLEATTGYAEAKGLPAPRLAVLGSGALLVLGGAGIVLGAYPALAAGAVAAFLAVVTPTMHDFWNAPADRREAEMTDFMKNAALFGGALAFLALGGEAWAYAANVGVL